MNCPEQENPGRQKVNCWLPRAGDRVEGYGCGIACGVIKSILNLSMVMVVHLCWIYYKLLNCILSVGRFYKKKANESRRLWEAWCDWNIGFKEVRQVWIIAFWQGPSASDESLYLFSPNIVIKFTHMIVYSSYILLLYNISLCNCVSIP